MYDGPGDHQWYSTSSISHDLRKPDHDNTGGNINNVDVERIHDFERLDEDGTVKRDEVLACQLKEDVHANDNQCPFQIGALEQLLEVSTFYRDIDGGLEVGEFLFNLFLGKFTDSELP